MTTVDAVVAAEAVLGRQLTDSEIGRVQTITAKGLGPTETWQQIFSTLAIDAESAAKRLLILESVAAANTRDHDTVLKTLYDSDVVRAEAVLGRSLADDERRRLDVVAKRGLSQSAKWSEILESLGVTPDLVVKRAMLLQIKAAASAYDYDAVVRAMRDEAETRLKRAGWA